MKSVGDVNGTIIGAGPLNIQTLQKAQVIIIEVGTAENRLEKGKCN